MILTTFLISQNADEDLEAYVRDTLLPMLEKLPGGEDARAFAVLASTSEMVRANFQLQLRFADEHSMNTAFASAEGRALSREMMDRSGKGVDMVTAESLS